MKILSLLLCLVILLILAPISKAQNLVPNGDFEINSSTQKSFKCEFEKGPLYGVDYWVLKNYPIDFNQVFSDWRVMISSCKQDRNYGCKAVRAYANYPLLVKQRKANPSQYNAFDGYFAKENIIKPYSGNCYIKSSNPSVINLFKIKLKEQTEIGQLYELSFYYYIDAYQSFENLFMNGDFGFALLENDIEPYFVGPNRVIQYKEEALNAYKHLYTIADTSGAVGQWKKHSTVFTADKAYQYLVLGNAQAYSTKIYDYPWHADIEHQIINVAIDQVNLQAYVPDYEHYKSGDVFAIENIHFASNSCELTETSFEALDVLIAYLKTNQLSFEISGHTDEKGGFKDNYKLSEDRAKSVYEYLLNNGINEDRMIYVGYGSTKPKHFPTNKETSELERQKNRRVEVKLY